MPFLVILLCCLFLALPASVIAGEFGFVVKNAEMTLQGEEEYVLNADFDYALSIKARDALQNGIPLYWVIRVKVLQHRDVLWNKSLVEHSIRYKIQYHALLNMYLVRNERSGQVTNFSTLTAALDEISTLQNFSVIAKSELDQAGQYMAAVQVKLDRDSLPLPLRPIALVNPQWYLSSAWYVWFLKN